MYPALIQKKRFSSFRETAFFVDNLLKGGLLHVKTPQDTCTNGGTDYPGGVAGHGMH